MEYDKIIVDLYNCGFSIDYIVDFIYKKMKNNKEFEKVKPKKIENF